MKREISFWSSYYSTDLKHTISTGPKASNTVDQTFSTTVLANATNLSFAVVASRKYSFKFHVYYTSASVNTGIRVGLTAPASILLSSNVVIPVAGDAAGAFFEGVINSSGDSVISTATPVLGLIYLATIEGQIIPYADGTVQLQVSSEVSASNIIVKNGSFIEIVERP